MATQREGQPSGQRPLLAIALDAADPALVETWMDQGFLPQLHRLREQGAYGRLGSSADWLAGSPWPTFYTGTSPGDHGLYHCSQWRGERMQPQRPNPDWLAVRPFWRELGEWKRRCVVVDMPMAYGPEPFDGIEISGWATHDLLAPPASYPREMMGWVRREIGPSPISEEVYGRQRVAKLLALRQELVRATDRVCELALRLMRREPWDLFAVAFGAPHRGGHKLWDHTGTLGEPNAEEMAALRGALRDVYVACDAALGRLLEATAENADVLVFSLHGMGPNTSHADILPALLRRILCDGEAVRDETLASKGVFELVRAIVPLEWRSAAKQVLPARLRDRISAALFSKALDWSRTQAFSVAADLQGYVRINLHGREAEGLVERGPEYDELCRRISEGLMSFVDAETGEAIVERIDRADRLFPAGRRLELLPDLLIRWSETASCRHTALRSERFGTLSWPTPGRHPDGRSGNHRDQGFLLARTRTAIAGSEIRAAHILDLAPTICTLLGVPPFPGFRGTPIREVAPAG